MHTFISVNMQPCKLWGSKWWHLWTNQVEPANLIVFNRCFVLGHGNNILFAPLLSLYLIFKMKFTFKVLNLPQKIVFVQNIVVLICKHDVTVWRTSYTSFKLFCYAYQVTMYFFFVLFDKLCRQKHLSQPLLVVWILFKIYI